MCVLGGRITLEQKYNAKNKLSSFYTWSQSVFSNFALFNGTVLAVAWNLKFIVYKCHAFDAGFL